MEFTIQQQNVQLQMAPKERRTRAPEEQSPPGNEAADGVTKCKAPNRRRLATQLFYILAFTLQGRALGIEERALEGALRACAGAQRARRGATTACRLSPQGVGWRSR